MALEKIYLHVGTPKTGTTSVQVDVTENMEFYKAHGVTYFPGFQAGYEHHSLANALFVGNKAEVAAAFAETLNAGSPVDFLVSSEMFYHGGLVQQVIECIPADYLHMVHVIIYVRRQDLYLESLVKQDTKTGWYKGPMLDYIDARWQAGAYATFIEDLRRAFPGINVVCRIFDRSRLAGGDILRDFRSVLNVPPPERPREADHWARNKTPCRELAEAAGSFDFPDLRTRQSVLSRVVRGTPELVSSGDVLSVERRVSLMESYREENRRLSDHCGVDLDALFFRDVDFERASRASRTPEESRQLREFAEACLRREYQAFLEAEAR